MKLIIYIMIFLTTFFASAQMTDLNGNVKEDEDKSNFIGVNIYLMQNGEIKLGAVTDQNGNYQINNIPVGLYDIKLSFLGFKDKIIVNYALDEAAKKLDLTYSDSCKKSKKICPYGHTDNLIPIVYGMPGDKLMEKADLGKVKLGGCIVSNCDPDWFCTKHNIEF